MWKFMVSEDCFKDNLLYLSFAAKIGLKATIWKRKENLP